MAKKRRGRKTPPAKCGNAFEMRCIQEEKGFECILYPRFNEQKSCAIANIVKGKITFYPP